MLGSRRSSGLCSSPSAAWSSLFSLFGAAAVEVEVEAATAEGGPGSVQIPAGSGSTYSGMGCSRRGGRLASFEAVSGLSAISGDRLFEVWSSMFSSAFCVSSLRSVGVLSSKWCSPAASARAYPPGYWKGSCLVSAMSTARTGPRTGLRARRSRPARGCRSCSRCGGWLCRSKRSGTVSCRSWARVHRTSDDPWTIQ